jgi:hypothetical protein
MPTNKLTNEQRQALQDFADKNGTQWKDKLIHLWNTGRDVGLLRQIRNQFGPLWLLTRCGDGLLFSGQMIEVGVFCGGSIGDFGADDIIPRHKVCGGKLAEDGIQAFHHILRQIIAAHLHGFHHVAFYG